MTRVKGWISKHLINNNKDSARARSFESGEPVYIEEIPSDAIRVEAVVVADVPNSVFRCGVVEVPAALIGKKVGVIIIETEAEEKT